MGVKQCLPILDFVTFLLFQARIRIYEISVRYDLVGL
jgi:hypothetical protein